MSLESPPKFSNDVDKTLYKNFFERTSPKNLPNFSTGESLTNLIGLAKKVVSLLDSCNPFLVDGNDNSQDAIIAERQWQLNQISEIKKGIAQAISYKKSYYENHLFGIITKIILKIFFMWNNGFTHSIITAEDFLLEYDSRVPIFKTPKGSYKMRYFFTLTPVSWIQKNCNTSTFYNYNPERKIPLKGSLFGLETIDSKGNPINPELPSFILRA